MPCPSSPPVVSSMITISKRASDSRSEYGEICRILPDFVDRWRVVYRHWVSAMVSLRAIMTGSGKVNILSFFLVPAEISGFLSRKADLGERAVSPRFNSLVCVWSRFRPTETPAAVGEGFHHVTQEQGVGGPHPCHRMIFLDVHSHHQ